MSKWTPGPWTWISYSDKEERPFTAIRSDSGEYVLSAGGNDMLVLDDDASLIAAAPALAEALRDLLGVVAGEPGYDDMEAATEAARAALAAIAPQTDGSRSLAEHIDDVYDGTIGPKQPDGSAE